MQVEISCTTQTGESIAWHYRQSLSSSTPNCEESFLCSLAKWPRRLKWSTLQSISAGQMGAGLSCTAHDRILYLVLPRPASTSLPQQLQLALEMVHCKAPYGGRAVCLRHLLCFCQLPKHFFTPMLPYSQHPNHVPTTPGRFGTLGL